MKQKLLWPAMAVLAPALALLTGFSYFASADDLSTKDRAKIEQIVREYILEHPEIIPEAMEVLRDRMQAAVINEHAAALFNDADTPVAGNPDGDVTVVEFFDYACGYCKAMLPRIQKALVNDGNIRLVLKEFPILGDASVTAAKAALAARLQGKYTQFHMALMGTKGRLSEDGIFKVAGEVGLDIRQLKKDMERPDIAEDINNNRQLARSLRIEGTPALIVGTRLASGAVSYEELMALVARARESKPKS